MSHRNKANYFLSESSVVKTVIIRNVYGMRGHENFSTERTEFSRLRKTESATL